MFYDSENRFEDLLDKVRADFAGSHEVNRFLDFLAAAQSSDRGFLRPRGDENGGDATPPGGFNPL